MLWFLSLSLYRKSNGNGGFAGADGASAGAGSVRFWSPVLHMMDLCNGDCENEERHAGHP